jgi:hypothetical protein
MSITGPLRNLPEVAVVFNIPEKTVCTVAQERQISRFNVRNQRQLKRDNILRWIDEQMAKVNGCVETGALNV